MTPLWPTTTVLEQDRRIAELECEVQSILEELRLAEQEIARLEALQAAAVALHVPAVCDCPRGDRYCTVDAREWPCPTVRALGVTE